MEVWATVLGPILAGLWLLVRREGIGLLERKNKVAVDKGERRKKTAGYGQEWKLNPKKEGRGLLSNTDTSYPR